MTDEMTLYHKYLYAIRVRQVRLNEDVTHVDKLLDNFIQAYSHGDIVPLDASDKDKKRIDKINEKHILEQWTQGRDIVVEYCTRMKKEIMKGISPEQIKKHIYNSLFGDEELSRML